MTNVVAINRLACPISTQTETREEAYLRVARWLELSIAGGTMYGLRADSPVFLSVDGGPLEALTAEQCLLLAEEARQSREVAS